MEDKAAEVDRDWTLQVIYLNVLAREMKKWLLQGERSEGPRVETGRTSLKDHWRGSGNHKRCLDQNSHKGDSEPKYHSAWLSLRGHLWEVQTRRSHLDPGIIWLEPVLMEGGVLHWTMIWRNSVLDILSFMCFHYPDGGAESALHSGVSGKV